jgi:hypothetical protein
MRGHRSPRSLGGSPVSLLLYVEDVDRTVEGAVAAGAKLLRPVENQFYGDRTGGIEDPFGHQWHVATHVEDVSPEEMEKRSEAMMAAVAVAATAEFRCGGRGDPSPSCFAHRHNVLSLMVFVAHALRCTSVSF